MNPVRRILTALIFLLIFALPSRAQVTIGASNYGTLNLAFSAIQNGNHTGNITILIVSDYSATAIASLGPSGVGSASYTSITIQPSGARTISGSVTGALISLNGADNVTIDGLNSSGNSLTLSNSSTSGSSCAIELTNGATGNTITRCTTLGSSTGFIGVINFTKTTGNSNNTITYCNIGNSTGGTPSYGVLGNGEDFSAPSSVYSNNNTISDNNIYNYCTNNDNSIGILVLDGNNGWTIENNRFYQTASRSITNTSGTTKYHGAIWVYSKTYSSTFTIADNIIGYANSSGTGTYTVSSATASSLIDFFAITAVTGSGTSTANIDGNQIKNVSVTTVDNSYPFVGIFANTGTVNIGSSSANTISGITVSLTYSTGAATIPVYGVYFNGSAGLIDNCSINNIWTSYGGSLSTVSLAHYGIYCSGTVSSISNNTIGSSSAANNIVVGPASGTDSAPHFFKGIYVSSASNITVSGNIVSGISLRTSGTTGYAGGIDLSAGSSSVVTMANNTIKNFDSYSARASLTSNPSVYGINFSAASNGNSVYGNRIYNLKNQNTSGSASPAVTGFLLAAGSSSTSSFYGNYIYDLGTVSSSPTSSCNYLSVSAGTWNINNNMLSAANNLNKTLTGIDITGGTVSLFFNSILVAGTNSFTGTAVCVKHSGGTVSSADNIFFNSRSNSGSNYAYYTSSSSNFSPNYNLYVSPDTTSNLIYRSTPLGWYAYCNAASTDLFSWAELSSQISYTTFFTDPSNGDLSINTASPLCWYVNGKGWPMGTLTYDCALTSGVRSSGVGAGSSDIGADEFTTTTTPIAATHVGAYTAGSTSAYYFGGRKITEIAWQSGSNLPSSIPTVYYYSGTNPPYPISGTKYFNAYWHITAPATSGMSYKLKLWYSGAITYTISSQTDIRMAKNSGTSSADWAYASTTTSVNTTARSFENTATYNSFSFFTGTDNTNPLPVEWLHFNAVPSGKDVLLTWATASEINNSHFEIEKSSDGRVFEKIGRVEGSLHSNAVKHYNYLDQDATTATRPIYYRLKQVDQNGAYAYSDIRVIEPVIVSGLFSVSPNPFEHTITLAWDGQINENLVVTVTDLNGRIVYEQNVSTGTQNKIQLEHLESLSSGVYFLSVYANGEVSRFKMVK